MTREILFRGKRIDNGEWVYGLPQVITETRTHIVTGYLESIHVVDNITFGQFTGLLDKNGTRIFEGAVIGYSGDTQGYVVFKDGEFMLQGIKPKKITSLKKYAYLFEVIGNIHDNQELLKGGAGC